MHAGAQTKKRAARDPDGPACVNYCGYFELEPLLLGLELLGVELLGLVVLLPAPLVELPPVDELPLAPPVAPLELAPDLLK